MRLAHFGNADLAHLVERNLAKVEVAGSSPVIRLLSFSDVRKYIAFFVVLRKNEKSGKELFEKKFPRAPSKNFIRMRMT